MIKLNKKIVIYSAIMLLVSSILLGSNAANDSGITSNEKLSKLIALFIGKSDAVIAGENKKIDSTTSTVVPFTEDSRTYVPVRFVSEALGATVNWEKSTNTVQVTSQSINIKLIIGQKTIVVNEKSIPMDVSAMVKDGRTFVPVRFIAEALGKNIFYESGLIIISASDVKIDGTKDKLIVDNLRQRINKAKVVIKGEVQKKSEPSDLSGEVESITDNNISLKVIEPPKFNENQKNDAGNMMNTSSTQRNQEKRTTKPAIKYTGEIKVIKIITGILITSMNRTSPGAVNTSLGIGDIKIGDNLSVWYSDKIAGTISKISVMRKR